MTWTCPKGHQSDDPDFCSECGARIGTPATDAVVGTPASAGAPEDCPDCGTPRVPGARFCEMCRHDFTAPQAKPPAAQPASTPPPSPVAAPGPSPVPVPAPAAPPPSVPSTPAAAPDPQDSPYYGKSVWASVTVEPSLAAGDEAAGLPVDRGPWTFPLDFAENLVGRRGSRGDVHPEVPVIDRAVSARHAKLCRRDGGFTVIDIGSSNGTKLNGVEMRQGVEVPLMPGDTIDIGAWTRIVLEAR